MRKHVSNTHQRHNFEDPVAQSPCVLLPLCSGGRPAVLAVCATRSITNASDDSIGNVEQVVHDVQRTGVSGSINSTSTSDLVHSNGVFRTVEPLLRLFMEKTNLLGTDEERKDAFKMCYVSRISIKGWHKKCYRLLRSTPSQTNSIGASDPFDIFVTLKIRCLPTLQRRQLIQRSARTKSLLPLEHKSFILLSCLPIVSYHPFFFRLRLIDNFLDPSHSINLRNFDSAPRSGWQRYDKQVWT